MEKIRQNSAGCYPTDVPLVMRKYWQRLDARTSPSIGTSAITASVDPDFIADLPLTYSTVPRSSNGTVQNPSTELGKLLGILCPTAVLPHCIVEREQVGSNALI